MATEIDSIDQPAPLVNGPVERWLWLAFGIRRTLCDHEIVLTASFGRGRLEVLSGKVDYGLCEAELHVDVHRGAVPLESRWPDEALQKTATVRRTQKNEDAQSRKTNRNLDGGLGEKGMTAVFATGQETGHAKKESVQDDFDFSVQRVTHSGSPASALWRFEVLPGEEYLRGQLVRQVLGKVMVDSNAKHTKINARCEISRRSVKVIDSEGFLISLACNSKLFVIRALVRKAIFDRLTACLQGVELEVARHG